MRIYLAARFGRRDELREVARTLRRLGYVVTSKWLEVETDQVDAPDGPKWAENDVADVLGSDALVLFTEAEGTPGAGRGGRHVEFGVALGAGRTLITVGPTENIFHRHPSVVRVGSVTRLLSHLAAADNCVGSA